MITYKYARGKDNKLIDISNLNEKCRNDFEFYCIGCGNELIAKLGRVKVHHFAHKKVITCSGETYLHTLGKQLFFDTYTQCLKEQQPFFIEIYRKTTCNHYENELGHSCALTRRTQQFDLTQHFDKVSIESRERGFIADVLLSNSRGKEKIFVEIAVTHASSEEKINSNYRIVELEIQSEDDFEPIKRRCLSVSDTNVKFKNFKSKELTMSICKGSCKVKHNFFTLDNEGRCLLRQKTLVHIKRQLASEKEKIVKHEISKDFTDDYSSIFKRGVATFSLQNLKVKNCFVCRYHAENNSWQYGIDISKEPIFCKFLKIKCNSNQAVNCASFKLEKNYVEEILTNIWPYDVFDWFNNSDDDGGCEDENWNSC